MKFALIGLLVLSTLSTDGDTPNCNLKEYPKLNTLGNRQFLKGMRVGEDIKRAVDFVDVLVRLREKNIKSVPRFIDCFYEHSNGSSHLYVLFERRRGSANVNTVTFIDTLVNMPPHNNRVDSYIRIVEEAKKIEEIGVMLHLHYRNIIFRTLQFEDPLFMPYIGFAFSTDQSRRASIEKHSKGLRTIQEVHLANGSVKYTWLLSVARTILDFEYNFVRKAGLGKRSGCLYPDLYLNNCPNLAFNVPEDYTRSSEVVFNRDEYYDIPNPTPLYKKLSTYIAGGAQPTGNFDALLDILKEFAASQRAIESRSRSKSRSPDRRSKSRSSERRSKSRSPDRRSKSRSSERRSKSRSSGRRSGSRSPDQRSVWL